MQGLCYGTEYPYISECVSADFDLFHVFYLNICMGLSRRVV